MYVIFLLFGREILQTNIQLNYMKLKNYIFINMKIILKCPHDVTYITKRRKEMSVLTGRNSNEPLFFIQNCDKQNFSQVYVERTL